MQPKAVSQEVRGLPGTDPGVSGAFWTQPPYSVLGILRWRKPCPRASGPQGRFSTRSRLTTGSRFFSRRDRAISPTDRDWPGFSRSATPERPGPGGHLSAWPHLPALPTPEGPAQSPASLGNSHLHGDWTSVLGGCCPTPTPGPPLTDRVTYTCFDLGKLRRSKKESLGFKHPGSLTRPGSGRCGQKRAGHQGPPAA